MSRLQYPRACTLIVRPPKLLIAMTNTLIGRLGAASPELAANRIAARLEDSGKTEILSFHRKYIGPKRPSRRCGRSQPLLTPAPFASPCSISWRNRASPSIDASIRTTEKSKQQTLADILLFSSEF